MRKGSLRPVMPHETFVLIIFIHVDIILRRVGSGQLLVARLLGCFVSPLF
jgi:hypothetical protein